MNFYSEHDCTATLSSACVPIMSGNMRKTSGKQIPRSNMLLTQRKRKKAKVRRWDGESAKLQTQRSDNCFAPSPSHLRHFFVASCFFAFGTSPERRKCEDICEWPQRNTIAINSVNISKVYYYKNKFSMILKSSSKNAKRS